MEPPPPQRTAVPAAESAEMGARLQELWRRGRLVTSRSGPAEISLAGVGERFAAWRVVPPRGPSVIVRIPHVAPEEMHQDLRHEIAALRLTPPGVGPAPIAVHAAHDGRSPVGLPYVVTREMPGTARAPASWTPEHLAVHAAHLAQLHTVSAPGRGPVAPGPAPWAAVPAGPPSLLAEVEAEAGLWRRTHRAAIAQHGLEPVIEATLHRVAGIEPQIAGLDGFVLAHGDLCATNILWEEASDPAGSPVAGYIDFEWAQGDDPARDLAIIGGCVHGGPWYVPMDEAQVDDFVGAYLRRRAQLAHEAGGHDADGSLPDSVADVGSLRERMRAWTAYERTGMLLHLAERAPGSRLHREAFTSVRETLRRELGLGGPCSG